MGRACSKHEEIRNAYRILVGKPEGKKPLGRSRYRREVITKLLLERLDRAVWTRLI
jgi:hypothetical protein